MKPVVLIGGGAGGIGSATARLLHSHGYFVCGLDVSVAVLNLIDGDYRGAVVDLRDTAALNAAIAELRRSGPLAHIVGVAGRVTDDELGVFEDDRDPVKALCAFEDSLRLNLSAQFALLRCARDWLLGSSGDRSVTFISSINALAPFGASGYSSAKAGLHGLVTQLSDPLGALGVRINALAPGTIRTPLTIAEAAAAGDPQRFERAAAQQSLHRVGEPEDVAQAVLAFTQMRHVTGEVLRVDGGQTLSKNRPSSAPGLFPW